MTNNTHTQCVILISAIVDKIDDAPNHEKFAKTSSTYSIGTVHQSVDIAAK